MRVPFVRQRFREGSILTEMITNENLGIVFRTRFRNGQGTQFPRIFFCIRFHNDILGTSSGHQNSGPKKP